MEFEVQANCLDFRVSNGDAAELETRILVTSSPMKMIMMIVMVDDDDGDDDG